MGRDDVLSEVAVVERLLQTVRPGLKCDLHEGDGLGFCVPLPMPKEKSERVFLMAKALFEHFRNRGCPVTVR